MAELKREEITSIIEKNKTMNALSNLSLDALKARYITNERSIFKTAFLAAVNKKDENDMRVNYNVHAIRGNNLNMVAQEVYKVARRLEKLGFYLNYDKLIADFESILEDFEENIMDDINNENRDSVEIKLYVSIVTEKMMETLVALKNHCYSKGNNSSL